LNALPSGSDGSSEVDPTILNQASAAELTSLKLLAAVQPQITTDGVHLANGLVTTGDQAKINALPADTTAAIAAKVDKTTTVNGHALSGNVAVTTTDLNLNNLTNDAQTKAAIVPNTIPTAGQMLIGNAGGTAFAPVAASGDIAVTSTGATTIQGGVVTNAKLATVGAYTLKGNNTASTAAPADIAVTSAAIAALPNLSGTNTGNQTISIGGDVTAAGGAGALTATVTKINSTSLAGLATGLLKNTTGTGVPSIATGADLPLATSSTPGAATVWPPPLTDSRLSTINIQDAPYYGSGSGKTTSGTASAGATSITVTDPATFAHDQGLYLGGASADQIRTVVSVVGSDVNFSPALDSDVAPQSTTTTGSNAAGSATITVANGGVAYSSRRRVHIAGAGVGGTTHHAYCVRGFDGVAGAATVKIYPPTLTTVSAGAVVTVDNVMHDDTAAINAAQQAFATAGTSGTVLFPDGHYRCNGPLLDTSGANSILKAPNVLYGVGMAPIDIRLKGSSKPAFSDQGPSWAGAVVQTDQRNTTGFLYAGYNSASSDFGPFTASFVTFEDITFRTYPNPGIGGINGTWIGRTAGKGTVVFDTGTASAGTHTNALYAFQSSGNQAVPMGSFDDITVAGYYGGAKLSERFACKTLYSDQCEYAILPLVNDVTIEHAVVAGAAGAVASIAGTNATIRIGHLSIDSAEAIVVDSGNLLKGEINYTTGTGTQAIIGGANLTLRNLRTGAVTGGALISRPVMARTVINQAFSGAVVIGGASQTGGAAPNLSSANRYRVSVQIAAGTQSDFELQPNGSSTNCTTTFFTPLSTSNGNALNVVVGNGSSYIANPGNRVATATVQVYPRINGVTQIVSDVATTGTSTNTDITKSSIYTTTDFTSLTLSMTVARTGWIKVTELIE
jgi:hypothetical protein